MTSPHVGLVPFTADLLESVEPWFDHPEVQHRLGGRAWARRDLDLVATRPGSEFRGRTVTRAHSWVALDAVGSPVALVSGEVYDRWTHFDEDGLVHDPIEVVTFGLAYVVDPDRWRRGFGRATLLAVIDSAETSDVRLFVAGTDSDNLASQRCLHSAGFSLERPEPDWEDTVYYLLGR